MQRHPPDLLGRPGGLHIRLRPQGPALLHISAVFVAALFGRDRARLVLQRRGGELLEQDMRLRGSEPGVLSAGRYVWLRAHLHEPGLREGERYR